nr:immunoglobulin light chain junction region [Macaca mulatta]
DYHCYSTDNTDNHGFF